MEALTKQFLNKIKDPSQNFSIEVDDLSRPCRFVPH